jgi:uracil-DNA glycosylase
MKMDVLINRKGITAMKVKNCVKCIDFPCRDVKHASYAVPDVELDPARVSIMLVSEAAPQDLADYYYAGPQALFAKTTLLAFDDAGVKVSSIPELLDMGVYLTTAVKCGKTAYGIETATIERCSHLLERELGMFPNVQAYLLMGDVAIKAFNLLAKRQGQGRVIPAGSTYKIRGGSFRYLGRPVYPSYLQAGPSFFIEKSKRKMIAQDIAAALKLIQN